MTYQASDYLDLSQTDHAALFEGAEQVWDVLARIGNYLQFRLRPGIEGTLRGSPWIEGAVFIGPGTVVEPGANIQGPAWIGRNCRVGHGAYIRGNVIAGDGCVLGNSCEFKNAVLFNEAKVPHYSYVGDSVLGHRAHLGAGAILSNFRLDGGDISVRDGASSTATGRRKFGAIVGDRAEVGCQAVINPGSLLGRGSVVYPLTNWGGVLRPGARAKMAEAWGVQHGG
jgi:NDP-sugar pyrophosphorylase family protein